MKIFLLSILVCLFTLGSCKTESKDSKVDEEILEAELQGSLKTMTGEFIYADSAAVFQTKNAIYGVVINEIVEELIANVRNIDPDPYASFQVTLKVKIENNTQEDAWPKVVNIQNIIKVEQSKDDQSLRLSK
jgi:uncharacterized membrane-anchored protein YitT (DUF2179 family)